jgi:hypothetical protein
MLEAERWYNMTKRDTYLPQLKFQMGKEYELTLREVDVVTNKFGVLAAKFTVEYEGKLMCLFPHADLKRKLLELQRKNGGSLKDVKIKVIQTRMQSASGKKTVFIYDITQIEDTNTPNQETETVNADV